MLPGHSYLPNDRDFGNIELAKKKKLAIYIPDDWYSLFRKPGRKNPFSVCEMKSEDFVSIKSLKPHIVNRKVNTQKQAVNWMEMRWIRVTKDKPFQFSYKYSHNALEAWKVVDLARKTKGRRPDMGRVSLSRLYDGPRQIDDKKLADLRSLLDFILPVYHSFYQELSGCAGDDSGLETDQSDSES